MEQIVLFYSMHSKKCHPILRLIKEYAIHVQMFCVDSVEIRKRIKNGTLVSIKGVPTLLVSYDDSAAEVYEGEKVMQWFDQLIRSQYTTNQQENYYEDPLDAPSGLTFEPIASQDNSAYSPAGFSTIQHTQNSKERQMNNVKDIARQMEAERKRMIPDDDKNF